LRKKWSYYLLDGGNRQDFFLVVVPTIGELGTIVTGDILGLGADYIYQLLALQAIRVFRVAKLTKHLTGLKNLARRAFKSTSQVFYSMLVTIIFIVFCALFANELYKDSVQFAARRNDFQSLFEAMKAMIEFLFGENYFYNLENGYRKQDVIGLGYFVMFYYIANFIVLRMFIALIMDNFQFPEHERVNLQIQLFQKMQVQRNDLIDGKAKPFPVSEQKKRLEKQNVDEDHLAQFQDRWNQVVIDRAAERGQSSNVPKHLWDIIIEAAERKQGTDSGEVQGDQSALKIFLAWLQKTLRDVGFNILENTLFINTVAAAIIFSVILIQIDPAEAPILDPGVRALIDRSLLVFFTCEVLSKMFVFGAFSQAQPPYTSLQFPQGRPCFFSSTEEGGWNILDFTFICIMMVDVMPNGISLGGFKTIRLVRIVRPMQKNIETIKSLVSALIASFVSIMHVLNLLLLLMLLFGLMGITLFRGRLHSCNDISVGHFSQCIGNNYGGIPDVFCDFMDPNHPEGTTCPQDIGRFIEQQILVPRVWAPASSNFENIAEASMTLLRVLNADDLRSIFHSLMDIPKKTELICSGGHHGHDGCPAGESQYVVSDQPRPNSAPENILFPIVFIFVGSAFVSQLVIGVLVDSIRRQKGTALYTEEQRRWFATEETLRKRLKLNAKATPPKDSEYLKGREFLYNILDSQEYDNIMMAVIIVNTFWMATEHFPSPAAYHEIKNVVDQCFISIYTVETLAKLYSYGVITWAGDISKIFQKDKDGKPMFDRATIQSPYFKDSWNCFDFMVVLMSVLDSWVLNGVDLSEFKLLRVLRVFRLVKKVPVLQLMISTLLGATKSIVSALFFLGIWIFIFAAIGSDPQMFRHVREGKVINSRWNFENVVNSMMLLFRIATGDSWFDVIYDCAVPEPYCTPAHGEHGSDCGLGFVSYAFFILFWVGCNYIFLPLFVATLIDYFSEAQIDSTTFFTSLDCEQFANVWEEFDPNKLGYIGIDLLRPFIERLHAEGNKVGFRVSSDRARFKMVWTRVITNPTRFPASGIPVIEKSDQESLGLEEINRDTISKGFGYSKRANQIRDFIYKQTKIEQNKEVEFKYTAKVLVIFMRRATFQNPFSSADLVNRGAALQQIMGLLDKDEAALEDWKEHERWRALAIHHNMANPLEKHSSGHKKGGQEVLDERNLTKILKAVGIVRLELNPPDPVDETAPKPAKPTGDKRAELVKKIDDMNMGFEKIVDNVIDRVLWGGKALAGERMQGVVDILLDKMCDASASKFAKEEIKKMGPWTTGKLNTRLAHVTRYTSRQGQRGGGVLHEVSAVPRGWLNSQTVRKPKRIAKGPDCDDHTKETAEKLGQVVPVVPPRSTSLMVQPSDPVLHSALQDIYRKDAWKHLFDKQQQLFPQPTKGEPKTSLAWRERYEHAISLFIEPSVDPKPEPRVDPKPEPRVEQIPEEEVDADGALVQRGMSLPFGKMFGICTASRKSD